MMVGDQAQRRQGHIDRFAWIDVARGIGIIAVVAGHVWTRGTLRDALYSFHMPFFFLLSGYLSRPAPLAAFVRRQIATQGLTYMAYLLLLLLFDIMIEGARGQRPIFSHWPADIVPVLVGGSALRGPFTVFWFIPCLLVARIFYNGVAQRFPDPLSRPWLIIAAISLAGGIWIGARTDYSPLGLLTVPAVFFLLWAGAVGRVLGWRSWLWWIVLPLSVAGLFWFPPVNMKAGDYGWPILSLAGALATSALIFRLSRWRLPGAALLRSLGPASLVIMYLHVPIAHYLAPVAGKPLIFVLALVGPFLAGRLLARSRLTARLFLAQESRA